MANKTIAINIVGEDIIIDAGLDSFARANGYTDSEDPEASTKLEVAEAALKRFFRDTVASYNAMTSAEAARQAALSQSTTALDATTLTVTVS